MTEHRATFLAGTPTMVSYLLEGHDPTRHDISGLRPCMTGGAPLPPEVQARFETTFGTPLVNAYRPRFPSGRAIIGDHGAQFCLVGAAEARPAADD